jgi:ankyrin repeat protein
MDPKLRRLFEAILKDAPDEVRQALKEHPDLARAGWTMADFFVEDFSHYIYQGDTALHLAAAGQRIKIAELLIAAGADPNSAKNRRRSTPLHYAADGGVNNPHSAGQEQVRMIQLLIHAGADIHAQDANGATPLHRAVRKRRVEAVKALLEAGSDPLARNKPGSTPFHLAVQSTGASGSGSAAARAAQIKIIELFLRFGVRPESLDQKGKSVLDWAKSPEIRQLLSGSRS